MIEEINNLLSNYYEWLKDKTAIREIKEWVEITTPYLDRYNDYIQIYVKRNNSGFLLTDDSNTIEELELSGCNLETTKRQQLLQMTLNGFGIRLNKKALETNATVNNFSLQKHNLIQAILAVNDLFYLATPTIESLFYEDVVSWLDINEIRYSPRIQLPGKTGYSHVFDFVIPKSKKFPERVIQTINRPAKDTAQSIAFAWVDTRDSRPEQAIAYAILNDTEKIVSSNVIEAMENYDIHPIPYSQREQYVEQLIN